MINGDVKEFVDSIHYGDELIFVYNDEKFFLQGLFLKGKHNLYLTKWEPQPNNFYMEFIGDDKYPVEDFLNVKLWDGRKFWEAESEMEWVDA